MLLYHNYLEKYKDVIEFTRQHLEETAGKWSPDYHPWALPEHRMQHTLLVLKNSLLLAKNKKVNLDVVALSAILHDIAFYSPEGKEHADEGVKIAEKYMTEHGYSGDLARKVVHAIRVHSGPLAFGPKSKEAKILQDADTIDNVGALAITNFLLYYGSRKMMPKQAFDELKKEMTKKLKRLRQYHPVMNTPKAEKIVSERCKYIRAFIKKLQKEM